MGGFCFRGTRAFRRQRALIRPKCGDRWQAIVSVGPFRLGRLGHDEKPDAPHHRRALLEGEAATTDRTGSEDREASAKDKAAHRIAPVIHVPRRRNQMLAVALVSVMTSLFVIVIGIVIFLHYAETHHVLATL